MQASNSLARCIAVVYISCHSCPLWFNSVCPKRPSYCSASWAMISRARISRIISSLVNMIALLFITFSLSLLGWAFAFSEKAIGLLLDAHNLGILSLADNQ